MIANTTRPITETKIEAAPRKIAQTIADKSQLDSDEERIGRAQLLLRENNREAALREMAPLLRQTAVSQTGFGAQCLSAQILADKGRHEEAIDCCRRANAMRPLAPLPYRIESRIAQERGDWARAKELLKKVVYLAPHDTVAHVELWATFSREGDLARARSCRESALRLLSEYSKVAQANNASAKIEYSMLPSEEWSLDAPLRVDELRALLGESR